MILVCGEALVDLFVSAPEAGEMPARAVAGGSPFNLAIGLARLGVPTAFLGGLARDRFGTFLAERLEGEGVDGRFLVRRDDRPTTISAIVTAPDGQPAYSFHGEGAADRWLEPADLPAGLPPEITALTFGSYTMAVEPVGSTLAALATREAGRRVISVDPNLRPAVVGSTRRWAEAVERFYRAATIIKASDEDIRTAWEGQVSIEQAAAYWMELGAALVVVTQGAAGATAFCRAGRISTAGLAVEVVDTVGAGDSFHAALLAWLVEAGRMSRDAIAALDLPSLSDLLACATAAAAVTVTRRGADMPRRMELCALTEPRAAPG